MLLIEHPARIIPAKEFFDNRTQEFISIEEKHFPPMRLQLEHSLMSIAKWEGHWHKPFVEQNDLSGEEFRDYIICMTINSQKNTDVYDQLEQDDLVKIVNYMQESQSAWEIKKKKNSKKRSKEKEGTAEAIYYAMIQLGIPMECEKWHFSRLVALLDYSDSKGGSTPGGGGGSPAKRSQKELMEFYRALNEKNRKKYNSKG